MKKVILVMFYNIVEFPPVLSLCNILRNLGYKVVYIGGCSREDTKNKLEALHIKVYDIIPCSKKTGFVLQKMIMLRKMASLAKTLQFRREAARIIKHEYTDGDMIRMISAETVFLLSSLLGKYNKSYILPCVLSPQAH